MPNAPPVLPDGLRLYVIGDIHGRADLLVQLMKKIGEDSRKAPAKTRKIFLGDYVDRGLYSREVIDYLLDLRTRETEPPVFLLGNHEQVMRELLRGRDGGLLDDWLRFGGRETLLSYGVPAAAVAEGPTAVMKTLREKISPAHIDFLERRLFFLSCRRAAGRRSRQTKRRGFGLDSLRFPHVRETVW